MVRMKYNIVVLCQGEQGRNNYVYSLIITTFARAQQWVLGHAKNNNYKKF